MTYSDDVRVDGYPPGVDCAGCALMGRTRADGSPVRMQRWRAGTIVNQQKLTHVCGRCGRHEVSDRVIVMGQW